MTSTDDFGPRLRALRTHAGFTLERLSEVSGVSVRAISDMERGRSRFPQPRSVAALSEALGVELTRAPRGSGRPRTCDLPRSPVPFVGRTAELALITRMVTVLHGPPGVGKTALAIRAAELQRHRFPDGVFFLDQPGEQATLLRALGVTGPAHLRSVLRQRRCLIVLDDADSEAQLRGLLPGAGASAVLVTSRSPLAGLEAVHRIPVGPLSHAAAVELLAAVTGRAGPELDEVARWCGHLPLALRNARPESFAQLADPARRLAVLTPVADAVAVSYEQVSEPARALLRRLARATERSFSEATAAALTGYALHEAEDRLAELLDLGLLQAEGPDRYRIHELIRLYAAKAA
jgi:transcriptional regulator with XRE-family HTH domain